MTMFAQPMSTSGEQPAPDELIALSRLEATPNAIRLRIAALAPDQLFRGTVDRLSIAEELALAVDRERAYLNAFRRAQTESRTQLVEPQPGPALLDREFEDDIAAFFDLRRATLDLLRTIDDRGWSQLVTIPGGSTASLSELSIRLAQRDAAMLRTISEQRRHFLRTTGINELRDAGVAGKLGPNIGQ
jgi:hypothetical protein